MEDEAKKEKKGDAGAPPWIMTFADLMSLLLAFFVLLFSFSELDKLKYKQIAGSMKEAFGVQRKVKIKDPPRGINIIATEFSAGKPEPTPMNVVRQHTTDHLRAYLKVPQQGDKQHKENDGQGSGSFSELKKALAKEIAKIIAAEAEKLKVALAKEIESGLVDIETEGEKIIIRIREQGSFGSGSADVYTSFRPVLKKMASALQHTKGEIIVGGHTDNIPIYTELYRSNWELSSARAVSVVHELIDSGNLPQRRFRVSGYASTQPLEDNSTNEGRARNRRVEVTVVYGDDVQKSLSILQQDNPAIEQIPANETAPADTGQTATDGDADPGALPQEGAQQ